MRIKVSEADVAWCAGLFVGEGHAGRAITRGSSGVYEYISLILAMYDRRAVERFANVLGLNCHHLFNKLRQHDYWRVLVRGRTAERAFAVLWPFLSDTDKGDQILKQAERLGIQKWITGEETGVRPQLNNVKRGRKVPH